LLVSALLLGCTERKQRNLIYEADERLHQHRHEEAVELYRKAISLNPESAAAITGLYKLGFAYETLVRDHDAALFNFNEFIRLSRDPVKIYEVQKRVANIYFDQGKEPEKAIAAYKKLMAFSPDSLETDLFQFRVAQGHFQQNNFEQARIEFEELLEKFPKSPYVARARFEIGNAYYMEGKYDMGIEALKQVIRNHMQSEYATEAEFLMAQCMEQSNKLAPALQVYKNLRGRYTNAKILEFRITELEKRIKKEK
jgi:TolA-binding protein